MRYTSVTSTANIPLHTSKTNPIITTAACSSSCSSADSFSPHTAASDDVIISSEASTSSTALLASNIGKPCTVFRLGETVYSGPASGRLCGAWPDDVAEETPPPPPHPTKPTELCVPAPHHIPPLTNGTAHPPNTSTNPPESPDNNHKDQQIDIASLNLYSYGRTFEASRRDLDLTCSSLRSFASIYSRRKTSELSSSVHNSETSIGSSNSHTENNNCEIDQIKLNGIINNSSKERSRGIITGCKAGPKSRVKRCPSSDFPVINDPSSSNISAKSLTNGDHIVSENCVTETTVVSNQSVSKLTPLNGVCVSEEETLTNKIYASCETVVNSENNERSSAVVGSDIDGESSSELSSEFKAKENINLGVDSKSNQSELVISENCKKTGQESIDSSVVDCSQASSPDSVVALGDVLEDPLLIDSDTTVTDPTTSTDHSGLICVSLEKSSKTSTLSEESDKTVSSETDPLTIEVDDSHETNTSSTVDNHTETNNRQTRAQKKTTKSVVNKCVEQVNKLTRGSRRSPRSSPFSTPGSSPRNSPLPPADAAEVTVSEANTDTPIGCSRTLRSRTHLLGSEKLNTIVEAQVEQEGEQFTKIGLRNSKHSEPCGSLTSTTGSVSTNHCTVESKDKDITSNSIDNINPVACNTRSSSNRSSDTFLKPSNLLETNSEEENTNTSNIGEFKENNSPIVNKTNKRSDLDSSSSASINSNLRVLRRNSTPSTCQVSNISPEPCQDSEASEADSPPSRRTTRSLSSDCTSVLNTKGINISHTSSSVPVVAVSSSPTTSVATTLSQSDTSTILSSSHCVTRTRQTVTPVSVDSVSSSTIQESANDKKLVKVESLLADSGSNSKREMVRLIQDHSNSFDSYCRRRGNRSSRRLCSADSLLECEKQQQHMKLLGSRKQTRSECYFSESEESCGGVEDGNHLVRNGRLGGGHQRSSHGTNGLGMHLIEKMATRNTSKLTSDPGNPDTLSRSDGLGVHCNGGESMRVRLLNGSGASVRMTNKNKHRHNRINNASDDSDCSSTVSKANGVDHSSDKVDINLLLEISVADRDQFEKKKAKRRKKCADWCLISETEKIINEKEEILKNKNRPDSSSDEEEEEEEDDEEKTIPKPRRTESRLGATKMAVDNHSSEDSDSNFFIPERKKSARKNSRIWARANEDHMRKSNRNLHAIKKEPKTEDDKADDFNETHTPNGNSDTHLKNNIPSECLSSPGNRSKGRPRGSRSRRTIYDLTRLNEDTDDDNFFSFPVNSGLGQSPVSVQSRDRRSSRSATARLSNEAMNNNSKKRLSDAERFLRDNKEYYQFPETTDRLRTSHERSDGEKTKNEELNSSVQADDDEEQQGSEKEDTIRKSRKGRLNSPVSNSAITENADAPASKSTSLRTRKGRLTRNRTKHEGEDDNPPDDQENTIDNSLDTKPLNVSLAEDDDDGNFSDGGPVRNVIPACTGIIDRIEFSFEHIPKAEPWYQTYKRQVDGNRSHEYHKEDDHLRFILPYQMPREYFRDPLAKRNLANKKRADLAELARKSPRCHASTLALFSDIIPGKRKQQKRSKSSVNSKEEDLGTSDGTSTPGADSNSRLPLTEHFETLDDYIAIEHFMNMMIRAAHQKGELPSMEKLKDDISREADKTIFESNTNDEPDGKSDPDVSTKRELRDGSKKDKRDHKDKIKEETSEDEDCDNKRDSSRRKKRKRQYSTSSSTSHNGSKAVKQEKCDAKPKETQDLNNFLKDLKLENDSLATEVDPQFLLEMQQELTSNEVLCNTLSSTLERPSAALCTEASNCKCTAVPQYPCYDDLSSVDDNTEASSECMSLVDSENLDITPGFNKWHSKKRRKNLTGWPKVKKKRLVPTVPTSEDNDSALGFDDHLSRKRKKFAGDRSSPAEETDRRASPRKKLPPLDAVPPRLRSAK